MSKRQAQDEEMPRGVILFLGVGGGVLLSIVWCALGKHFDRLDTMESDIYAAKRQITELQDFAIAEKKRDQATVYTCDEMKKWIEGFGKGGWSEWYFSDLVVKGACK